jgi:molecular chaperone DnaJ
MPSLYASLGVDRRATAKEIKRAYYAAAHDCHPDKRPDDPRAAARFSEISLAYTVLGDPASRKRYDLLGPMALGLSPSLADLSVLGPEGEKVAQAVSAVVGGVWGRLRRPKKAPKLELHIDVATALRGGTRQMRMRRKVACATCTGPKPPGTLGALAPKCRTCGGKGSTEQAVIWHLRIPQDSGPKDILRMAKAGPMGQDLMVHLRIEAHPLIRCRGLELYVDLPIRPSDAALGGTVTLAMPHKNLQIAVPQGCQTGDMLVLSNEGLRGGRLSKRGALHVTFDIETPSALSPAHRAAYEALAAAERQSPSAFRKSLAFGQNMQH